MQYLVSVLRDGVESTLGPFAQKAAEDTVTRLASEPSSRDERFRAFLIPVPDDAEVSEPLRGQLGI
jgi:hypothetical protein